MMSEASALEFALEEPTGLHENVMNPKKAFSSRMRRLLLVAAPACLFGVGALCVGVRNEGLSFATGTGKTDSKEAVLFGAAFSRAKTSQEKDPTPVIEEKDPTPVIEDTFKLDQESEKWKSLQLDAATHYPAFTPLSVDDFLRTLQQQLGPWGLGPRNASWGIPIDPEKYSCVEEALELLDIGSGRGSRDLFFARPTKPEGEPRVVIKVVRGRELPEGHARAEMYNKASRCQLINCIKGNVLGYYDYFFPVQWEQGYVMVQVMQEYGFPAACLTRALTYGKTVCPRRPNGELMWPGGSFSNKRKAAIILGAMRAVAAMKKAKFVSHGDVKPPNILIPENALEITPMELADATRLIDHDSAAIISLESGSKKVRSPFFTPPEFIDTKVKTMEILSGVDVWACGMTLFELVVGKTPVDLMDDLGYGGDYVTKMREFFLVVNERFKVFDAEGVKMKPLLRGMIADVNIRWDIEVAIENLESFIRQ